MERGLVGEKRVNHARDLVKEVPSQQMIAVSIATAGRFDFLIWPQRHKPTKLLLTHWQSIPDP